MSETIAGTIVAALVAIVAGFGWVITYIQRCEDRASDARHGLRGELNIHMLQLEERLTSRIAALERYSVGYVEHRRKVNRGEIDDR